LAGLTENWFNFCEMLSRGFLQENTNNLGHKNLPGDFATEKLEKIQ